MNITFPQGISYAWSDQLWPIHSFKPTVSRKGPLFIFFIFFLADVAGLRLYTLHQFILARLIMSLWSCATCFRSFSRKGDLTRHQSMHTGIRPHVCETCGKGFAQFSGLKTHRNVHSKAKPYTCGIGTCTKAFGDPSSRTRHRKETHRGEGAYKCIECGTRIKRRSTFVAHLRKHGLDPTSIYLNATVLQSSGNEISAPAHFGSPAVECRSRRKVESQSASLSFLGDGSGHYALGDSGNASCFTDRVGWLDDDPIGCRRANWTPVNDALSLGLMLDQPANVGLPGPPHNLSPSLSGEFNSLFCFDAVFPTTVDYPLLVVSPSNIPVFEPFLGSESDGSQSSPPSSTNTVLHTDFNHDVALLPLARNASQNVPYSM